MDRSAFSKSGEIAGAWARDVGGPVPRAGASAHSMLVADADHLVTRALGILAEDNNMKGDESRSADLSLQRRVLSDGTECPLPIRYFDVGCLVATFLTEVVRAAELLKGTGLKPVPQEDGKGVVVIYCIEYRKTDIGPYNEVGLTVVAAAQGDPIPANYVVNLPVTTAVANRAGQEIWGYNKFVATIDVKSDRNKFATILRDTDGAMICAIEGTRGASVPVPPADILTFTLLKGRLIKTVIRVFTPFHVSSGDGFLLKVGPSRHPMTNHLRTAALDRARPLLVHYADPFQALLFPGRAL
jgi:hypothetical protein